MRSRHRSSTPLLLALLVFIGAVAPPETRGTEQASATRFSVGPNGALALRLPEAWKPKIKKFEAKKEGNAGLALNFESPEPAGWAVLFSGFWNYNSPRRFSADELKAQVAGLGAKYADQAAEPSPEVREIHGDGVTGYFISMTDKEPKPSEYEYLSQGVVRVGEMTIAFTVLSNGNPEPTLGKALSMLSTARFTRE